MLWHADTGFCDNLNLLLMKASVKLMINEHVDFLR